VQLFVFDQFFNGASQNRKTTETTFRFQEEDLILHDRVPNEVELFKSHAFLSPDQLYEAEAQPLCVG
jgi:hypothetical protein